MEEVAYRTGEHPLGVVVDGAINFPFVRIVPSGLGAINRTKRFTFTVETFLAVDVAMAALRPNLIAPHPRIPRIVCPAYTCVFCHDGLLILRCLGL